MELHQYRAQRVKGSISAGVRERWQTRIVAQGMRGQDGAITYLSRYGKGIAAPKCIELARMAESQGDQAMANHFWAVACKLETGQAPQEQEAASEDAPAAPQLAGTPMFMAFPANPATAQRPAPAPAPHLMAVQHSMFPVAPGELPTMQPIDGQHDQAWYARNPGYWGQPKVYGHRCIVFATADQVWYQARSLNLWDAPSAAMDRALRQAAQEFGPFILDGEKFYRDCTGAERMTAAQAATVNVQHRQPALSIEPIYAIFRCLFAAGDNLMDGPDTERLTAAATVGGWLQGTYPGAFELLPVARTQAEKWELIRKQSAEGREGEVWFQPYAPYRPGKSNKWRGEPVTVRTKYTQTLDVVVTGLEPTTVAGKAFSSMLVSVWCDGREVKLGRVGTGFTQPETHEIQRAFDRGGLVVEITTQGFTENRVVVHGSFVRMRPDKQPADCTVEPNIF